MSHGLHTAKNSDLFAVTAQVADWRKQKKMINSQSRNMTMKLRKMQLTDQQSYRELKPNFEKMNRARQKIHRNAAKTVIQNTVQNEEQWQDDFNARMA